MPQLILVADEDKYGVWLEEWGDPSSSHSHFCLVSEMELIHHQLPLGKQTISMESIHSWDELMMGHLN